MSDNPSAPNPEIPAQEEQTRNPWYRPDSALTDEQVDALRTIELPDFSRAELPGTEPAQPGGWYTPADAVSVAAQEEVIDQDFLLGLQPAPVADDFFSEIDEVPEPPSLDAEEAQRAVPEAPIEFGKADFRVAPEGPGTEDDEFKGGLRDELSGLSPDEARPQEEFQAEIPMRGLGGVRGGDRSQDTRMLSDTGDIGGSYTPAPSGTDSMQPVNQPAPQPPVQPNPEAEKFRRVEDQVAILRERYANGQMTRQQLETELRQLIVMDDQGRWWTIGVDSNRWYRYDGREWVPDTPPQIGPVGGLRDQQRPPQPQAQQPAQQPWLPTETSVPQPQQSMDTAPPIVMDDYGMPLPQRVPLDDPQATMVNLNAATASNEEATWERATQRAGFEPGEDVIPAADRSYDAAAEATLAGATISAPIDKGDSRPAPVIQQPAITEAEPKAKTDGQPDYSGAYGRSMDRSTMVRYGVWASVIGVVATLAIVLCGLLGMVGYYFSVVNQYSDRLDNLGARVSDFQTSRIYDASGNLIAQYNDPNTGARTEVDLEDVSPWVVHATISTEDETFYENPGFSAFAIVRAIYTNLTNEGPQSGASTITQQLVRALILDEDFAAELSAERKVTEIILAAELNRRYTKNEILELYLNEIYYGNLAYGIEAASQVYFDKNASDLNVFEAAFLAGLPQAPAVYDPVRARQVALDRMETVFRLMTEANDNGCLQMEHDTNVTDLPSTAVVENFNLDEPLCVEENFRTDIYPVELALVEATVFEPPAFEPEYAHFVNWVWANLEERYDTEDIYSIGFEVYTTLRPDIQNLAQQAVRDQLNNARAQGFDINNGAVLVMDPNSGAVLAMVGSADFNDETIDGQVNVLLSPQQPGSSIKPLVYLTAMEGTPDGYYTPATVIWDTPSAWGGYQPLNFDREFRGPVTVRRALANSLNVPAVKALNFVTPTRFQERAQELGIIFPLQTPAEAGLPSALGAVEIRMIDLVSIYSGFANGGQHFETYGISRIETADGDVIFEQTPQLEGLPINPAHAFLMNSILSDTQARAEEFGAGANFNLGAREVAVKTGTTDDSRDLVTIGWTPQMITGVWFGNTDNHPPGGRPTGYSIAAPVWQRVMQQALQDAPAAGFSQPDSVTTYQVCPDTGALVPDAGCGVATPVQEFFYVNQPPPQAEDGLIEVILVDPFSGLRANQFCADYAEERTFLNVTDPTAAEWLKTPAGQAWAQQRGISTDLTEMPQGECQEGQPRPEILLLDPTDGATVSGFVPIFGRAIVPNFARYELQYASIGAPDNFFPILTREVPPSNNNFLGDWDTSAIPNGTYILRLVVSAQNGASADSQVTVNVLNEAPQLEPTMTPAQLEENTTQNPGTEINSGAGFGSGNDSQEAVPPAEQQ